jgi:hypothetical protein
MITTYHHLYWRGMGGGRSRRPLTLWLTTSDWPVNTLEPKLAKNSAACAISVDRCEFTVDGLLQYHVPDDLGFRNTEFL